MNVWNGNPAILLTSWAKTTASVRGFLRKQVEEVARAAGFGLGIYTTRPTPNSLLSTFIKSHPPTLGIVAAVAAQGRLGVR
jgi:hypothetical protein